MCSRAEGVLPIKLGFPLTLRVDGIEVLNIIDIQYIGIDGILTTWGAFLSNGRFTTIVGCFMNWFASGEESTKTCRMEVIQHQPHPGTWRESEQSTVFAIATVRHVHMMAITGMGVYDALEDNESEPLPKYLSK